ncbi:uncharacterized protein TRUGW13939_09524 [Talaromyces rugulosus]|uniref:DASH complex subunit ASK1 n=1 Tax=Talaromyces rugulosus TaxID=121627 RepID=A0A7H8RA25_TALRU|nr:uncharacterized protein TRUGW13939_09524 [Talaromyces rugulosus]QKX62365.1 hypothetical protein TRUGW13939_09524 [Talaromyces rugulosus]
MSGSAQRNLTLTEELEKLEQSITLTLQEIDSNFSRAHRIVTTSILPVVEQYAEQSKDVWEGAKFWKQFFESSANVSLSGYEEQPNEDTEHEQTVTEDSTIADTTTHTTAEEGEEGDEEGASYETPSSAQHLDIGEHNNELDFSSLTISPSHSTPRPTSYHKGKNAPYNTGVDESPSLVAYPSLYHHGADNGDDVSALPEENTPVTPGRYTSKYHQQNTPMSSPFIPPSSHKPSTAKRTNNNKKPTDPVLHHVLDKTYRVQATPLSKSSSSYKPTKFTVSTPKDKTPRYTFDDSPISSPELEAPKLHEEIFSSPLKGIMSNTPGTGGRSRTRRRGSSTASPNKRTTPRPGVSVLTPGKPKTTATATIAKDSWNSDDDDDDDDGFGKYTTDDDDTGAPYEMSPPKTMQFHIPQSRLMKTPAKEASKRIVSDLLATAGGGGSNEDDDDDDDENYADQSYAKHQYYQTPGGGDDEGYSPTLVRSGARIEDDTF